MAIEWTHRSPIIGVKRARLTDFARCEATARCHGSMRAKGTGSERSPAIIYIVRIQGAWNHCRIGASRTVIPFRALNRVAVNPWAVVSGERYTGLLGKVGVEE